MRLAVRDPDKEFAPVDVSAACAITVLMADDEQPNLHFERVGDATLVTISSGTAEGARWCVADRSRGAEGLR